jgi:hypothetical protein
MVQQAQFFDLSRRDLKSSTSRYMSRFAAARSSSVMLANAPKMARAY